MQSNAEDFVLMQSFVLGRSPLRSFVFLCGLCDKILAYKFMMTYEPGLKLNVR